MDSDLLVVQKLPGEAVTKPRGGNETVLNHWRKTLGEPGLQLVHRIDQPVGGLVLMGRSAEMLPKLYESFRTGQAIRTYIAILTAPPEPEADTITDTIVTDPRSHTSRVLSGAEAPERAEDAKESTLHYRTIGNTRHHTVVAVRLATGRHHQIRVQLAHRGWFVLGDTRYGARRPMRDRSIGLYAWHLTVPHPRHGTPLTITAPLPDTAVWRHVAEIISSGGLSPKDVFPERSAPSV